MYKFQAGDPVIVKADAAINRDVDYDNDGKLKVTLPFHTIVIKQLTSSWTLRNKYHVDGISSFLFEDELDESTQVVNKVPSNINLNGFNTGEPDG